MSGLLLIKQHTEPGYMVKSGKFGHQVNSDARFANSGNPDETAPYEKPPECQTVWVQIRFILFAMIISRRRSQANS